MLCHPDPSTNAQTPGINLGLYQLRTSCAAVPGDLRGLGGIQLWKRHHPWQDGMACFGKGNLNALGKASPVSTAWCFGKGTPQQPAFARQLLERAGRNCSFACFTFFVYRFLEKNPQNSCTSFVGTIFGKGLVLPLKKGFRFCTDGELGNNFPSPCSTK